MLGIEFAVGRQWRVVMWMFRVRTRIITGDG